MGRPWAVGKPFEGRLGVTTEAAVASNGLRVTSLTPGGGEVWQWAASASWSILLQIATYEEQVQLKTEEAEKLAEIVERQMTSVAGKVCDPPTLGYPQPPFPCVQFANICGESPVQTWE